MLKSSFKWSRFHTDVHTNTPPSFTPDTSGPGACCMPQHQAKTSHLLQPQLQDCAPEHHPEMDLSAGKTHTSHYPLVQSHRSVNNFSWELCAKWGRVFKKAQLENANTSELLFSSLKIAVSSFGKLTLTKDAEFYQLWADQKRSTFLADFWNSHPREISTPFSSIKEKRQPGVYLDAFFLPSPPLQNNRQTC